MGYFRTTIVASLIVALVSFAGGFCMRPMMTEASDADMSMGIDHSSHAILPSQDCVSLGGDESSHKVNVCAIDCITTTPKITTTKKAVVENTLQISLITPSNDLETVFATGIFSSEDTFGVSPPVPDILSSIFKRE